jgi:thymidylate kinase
VRLLELQRYYSWIIDRFHISTQAYQERTHGKVYDFHWLEERLGAVGFRLIHLRRSNESFEAARERRLKVSGNPEQYNDLGYFYCEQEQIDRLVSKSVLPVYTADVSDNDIERVTNDIALWLKETGGLYAEY